jgi:Tol biopolymer transport system component
MIGRTVSHYRILERLGGGGMGVVYKAQDLRLDRTVALKFLPPDHFDDPLARERLEREAKTASALSHPHICTIHDIDEHEGRPFIAMELLEGQTLQQRAAAAPLPTAELVDLAVQVAEALDAAHARRIVHRDIKPANIFVTARGDAKVLDFGLAKWTSRPEPAASRAETATAERHLTQPGTAVGTVAYMSPEQVLGRVLDGRTDLFSFGVVLYEMATGRLPFAGDTAGAAYAAILHETPASPLRLNPALPDELARVIHKCLEKDKELRYQSAAELRADLRRLRRDAAAADGPPPRARRRAAAVVPWLAAAALAVGASAWWLVAGRRPPAPSGPLRIVPFAGEEAGSKEWPQLSPDGEKVSYVWSGRAGESGGVYVKALGVGTRPLRVTGPEAESDFSPVWSPDGRQIAFVRTSGSSAAIYTVPSLGGQERRVTDVSGLVWWNVQFVPALAWSPDGRWLAFGEKPDGDTPSRVVRISLDTRERQPLTTPPPDTQGDLYPSYSPDGSRLAFVRSGSGRLGDWDVWVLGRDEAAPRRVTREGYDACRNPVWTSDGSEILFTTGWGDLSIQRVRVAGGEPQPVFGVGTAFPSIRSHRAVYQRVTPPPQSIWRAPGRTNPLRTREPEKLIASNQTDGNPAYSPDGRKIAFHSDRSGVLNIWVCDSEGQSPVQVTSLDRRTGTPRWSPDGRRLLFDSIEAGDWNIYVVDADGGPPRRLTPEPSGENSGTWSRDGRWIYFSSNRSGSDQIWRMPSGGGPARQVTRGGGYYAEESWDGRYVYYTKDRAPTGVWKVPVEGGEETEVVGGAPLAFFGNWTLARGGLYYATIVPRGRESEYEIHYLDFASRRTHEVLRQVGTSEHMWLAVSPDEQWILYAQWPPAPSELMLVENFR